MSSNERGRPTKKRQDVSALMKEAAMLIDTAEINDKDIPISQRGQRPQPRQSLTDRTQVRSRRLTTQPWRHGTEKENTPRGIAKSQPRPPPRTIKDLIHRRFTTPKRLTRYQTSEFFRPNVDIEQTKNKGATVQKDVQQTQKPKEPEKQNQNIKTTDTVRDYKIPAHMYDMRTPRQSPEPMRASPVSKTTKTVTKTTKQEITVTETVTEDNQGTDRRLSKTESLQKEFGFVEDPDTLVGTARKEEAERMEAYFKSHGRPKVMVSTRRESRTSVHVQDNSKVSRSMVSLRKSPTPSRSPSKASIRQQNETLHRKDSKASIYLKQETPRNANYRTASQSKANLKTDNTKSNASENIRSSRTSLQIKDMSKTYKSEQFIAPSLRASRTSLQVPNKSEGSPKDTTSDSQDIITPRRTSKQSMFVTPDSKQPTPTSNTSDNGESKTRTRSRSRSMSNERKQRTPTQEAVDLTTYNGNTHTRSKSKERKRPTPTQQTGDTRSLSKERNPSTDGENTIKTHARNKSKERNQPTPRRQSVNNNGSSDNERSLNRLAERKQATTLQNGLANGDLSDNGHSRNKSQERNQPTPSKFSAVYGATTDKKRSRNRSIERKESTSTQASGIHDTTDKSPMRNTSQERKHSTSSKEASVRGEQTTQEHSGKSRTRNKSHERRQSTSSKEASVYGDATKERHSRSKSRERKQSTSTRQPMANGVSNTPGTNRKMSQVLINSEMSNRSNTVDRKPQTHAKQTIVNGELPIIGRKTSIVSTENASITNSQHSRNRNYREIPTSERQENKQYKRPVNAMYRKATDIVTPNQKVARKPTDKAKKNEHNVTLKHTEYDASTHRKNIQNKGKFEPIQARQNRPSHGKPKGFDDKKRYMSKSVGPLDNEHMNGHENTYDTRVVRREDYERQGRERVGRKRSTSVGRKRHRSQERRSHSRERKRSTSQTRIRTQAKEKTIIRKPIKPTSTRDTDTNVVFPNIVAKKKQKEMPRASPIPSKQTTQTTRATRVVEKVNERVITPKRKKSRVPDTGGKWQDLVQKYIRQPSPKLGKTDDSALLDINYDSESTTSEMDIFERAKRRYELQSDDSDADY